MESTLAAIERDHGLIQVLFNNAGIYHPGKDWLDVPSDQFDDTMSVKPPVSRVRSSTPHPSPASAVAPWSNTEPPRRPSST